MKQILILACLSAILCSASGEGTTKSSNSTTDSMIAAASSLASKVDWENLSWDDVSGIPYGDKDELVNWAMSQVNKWKGPLTEASKKQGLNALSSLGTTGWQGYLKKVVAGIDSVRKSSPETYETSKNALLGAWEIFEKEATKYLNKG